MKVLLANKYFHVHGGADRHFIELQELLEQRGQETVPFSMRHPRNHETPYEKYFVRQVDYYSRSIVHRASAGLRFIYNLESRRKIRSLIRDERPDIAHLHNIYHQLSPSFLPILKAHGIPVVLTAHDLKLLCPSYLMYAHGKPCERCRGGRFYHAMTTGCHNGSRARGAWLAAEMYVHKFLRLYANNVDLFICPSRFYRDKFIEFGVPPERVRWLPYFLDVSRYEPSHETGRDLVYFGRLSREKGLSTLVSAMASVPGAQLRIVGDGPLRAELERQAAPLGERVVFTGRLSGADLHGAIRSARACVIPTEWYENCPLSVQEAHALGRPVVGSRIGGLPELVDDGETGWLFEPGSADRLAETLAAALAAPNIVEMSRNCRRVVTERFSPEAFYAQLEDIYASARNSNRNAGECR